MNFHLRACTIVWMAGLTFSAPASAQDGDGDGDGRLIPAIAALVDRAPETTGTAACALLPDRLDGLEASVPARANAGAGFQGAPIACRRRYRSPSGEVVVGVYTEPNFAAFIAQGPPPGADVARETIAGRTAYPEPARVDAGAGLVRYPSLLLSNGSEAALSFILQPTEQEQDAVFEENGGIDADYARALPAMRPEALDRLRALAAAIPFDALQASSPAADAARTAEASLRANLETMALRLAPNLLKAAAQIGGPVEEGILIETGNLGDASRCASVGYFEFELDPSALDVYMGEKCVADLRSYRPTDLGDVGGRPLSAVIEPGPNGDRVDALMILSDVAAVAFTIYGDVAEARSTAESFDLSAVEDML